MSNTKAAFVALLILHMLTGCTSSPGSMGARLSENGRLLQDGPQALMTSATISAERQNDVPILYEFAIEANALRPLLTIQPGGSSSGSPATDVAAQQIALSSVPAAAWPAITKVGEGRIDRHCTQFISALYALEKEKKATLANMNALQSATVGIMGLALAAQKAIGITGVAFGLAASLFDNTTSTMLYQMPAQSITSIVLAQRTVLRTDEDKALATVTNQGMAAARLAEYIRYCIPVTIEANISNVLGNAKAGRDGSTIETSITQAAVTSSALAPQISGIRPSPTNIHNSGKPITVAIPAVRRLNAAEMESMNALSTRIDALSGGHDTLVSAANAVGVKLDASTSQLDATQMKQVIKGTAYNNVLTAKDRQAELSTLNKRLDSVVPH